MKAKVAPASVVRGGTFELNVDAGAQSLHKNDPKPTGEIAVTFGSATRVVPLTGDPTYAPAAAVHQRLRVRWPTGMVGRRPPVGPP